MRILITGTPGVGKTVIAKTLAEKLRLEYVNLSHELVSRGLTRYDNELDSHEVINDDYARKFINTLLIRRNSIIAETIALELVSNELIDWIVVLRLKPEELMTRLLRRNWNFKKVRNNVLSEILDVLLIDSLRIFGKEKIIEVNTTGKPVDDVVNEIIHRLVKKESCYGVVDWVSVSEDILITLEKRC